MNVKITGNGHLEVDGGDETCLLHSRDVSDFAQWAIGSESGEEWEDSFSDTVERSACSFWFHVDGEEENEDAFWCEDRESLIVKVDVPEIFRVLKKRKFISNTEIEAAQEKREETDRSHKIVGDIVSQEDWQAMKEARGVGGDYWTTAKGQRIDRREA